MKYIIMVLLLTLGIYAKSNTEKIGDFLTFAIPAAAYGSTYYVDDKAGREEFYWSYGVTMASTVALKYTVREKRPDNNDKDSFPSGHTASAVAGAVFVHKRYGLRYAAPLYLAAAYTGYSRIQVNRHHPHDVAAGALIGAISAWYFTTPNEKFHITPVFEGEYKGVNVNFRF